MSELQEKYQELASLLQGSDKDSKRALKSMIEVIVESENMVQLRNTDVVTRLIKIIEAEVFRLNERLQNERTISETERNYVFASRDIYKWFIALFSNAEETLKGYSSYIDQNIDNLKAQGFTVKKT